MVSEFLIKYSLLPSPTVMASKHEVAISSFKFRKTARMKTKGDYTGNNYSIKMSHKQNNYHRNRGKQYCLKKVKVSDVLLWLSTWKSYPLDAAIFISKQMCAGLTVPIS